MDKKKCCQMTWDDLLADCPDDACLECVHALNEGTEEEKAVDEIIDNYNREKELEKINERMIEIENEIETTQDPGLGRAGPTKLEQELERLENLSMALNNEIG